MKYCLLIIIVFVSSCKSNNNNNNNNNNKVVKNEWSDYNILWIVADDLGKDLGCYGNNLV